MLGTCHSFRTACWSGLTFASAGLVFSGVYKRGLRGPFQRFYQKPPLGTLALAALLKIVRGFYMLGRMVLPAGLAEVASLCGQ